MEKWNLICEILIIAMCMNIIRCSDPVLDSSKQELEYQVFNYPLTIGTTWTYHYFYSLRNGSEQRRYGVHTWTVVDSVIISTEMVGYKIESIDLDTLVYSFGTDSIFSLIEDTTYFFIDRGTNVVIARPPSRYFNNIEDYIEGFFGSDQSVHLGSPWPDFDQGRFYKGGFGLLKMFGQYLGNTREVELLNLLEFNGKILLGNNKVKLR